MSRQILYFMSSMNGKALELDTPADSGLRERARPVMRSVSARERSSSAAHHTAGSTRPPISPGRRPGFAAVMRRLPSPNRRRRFGSRQRNGVFVNGERIQRAAAIRAGDIITIGGRLANAHRARGSGERRTETIRTCGRAPEQTLAYRYRAFGCDVSVATRRADAFNC